MTRQSPINLAAVAWGVILLLLTLAAYRPALHDTWIWDDDAYITTNPCLHDAVGLKKIWIDIHSEPQYYPLVHTTFWIEHHLWGLWAAGYHFDNVLLHAVAALLVWRVLTRLRFGEAADTDNQPRARWLPGAMLPGAAWVAAAVFALHPVCVESVVWVTERKNVLMLACYMLAMWAYLRAEPEGFGVRSSEFGVEEPVPGNGENFSSVNSPFVRESPTPNAERRTADFSTAFHFGWYLLALLFFVAAMLSKTVAASFPVAVLIILWWRRGRVRLRSFAAMIPFLVIGAGMGLLTASLERTAVGAEGAEFALSIPQRILVAGRALWFYAAKLAWPSHLCFIYPHWAVDPRQAWQWAFPVGALILAAVLMLGRPLWGRGPFAGAAFFAVTLAPALGFLNVYPFRYSYVADHFQYVAALGLIVLGVGGATALLRLGGRVVTACGGTVLAAAVLASCGWVTYARCPAFANAQTLWRDTLATNDTAWIAHNALGVILGTQGKTDQAIAHFRRVLELKADHVKARANLGVALESKGDLAGARAEFERAVYDEPRYPDAHNGLGHVLFEQGDVAGALEQYRQALKANPHFPEALVNLGVALGHEGQTGAAIGQFEAALRERPNYALAHVDLAALLDQRGDLSGAIAHFESAAAADPNLADAQLQWGRVLARHDQLEEAIRHLERGVELRPDDPAAHNALGIALARSNRLDQAIGQFEEALRLNPRDADTKANLDHARAKRGQ